MTYNTKDFNRFADRILQTIPNDRTRCLADVLDENEPYRMEAFAAIKGLERAGLVVMTWNTYGASFVQRTVL